jgi:hypothetical protein
MDSFYAWIRVIYLAKGTQYPYPYSITRLTEGLGLTKPRETESHKTELFRGNPEIP